MSGFNEPGIYDCPLTALGVGAVDNAQAVMAPSDVAHTEGAFLGALSECLGACSLKRICLINNPDETESAGILTQYAELFEAAQAIGKHESNEGVHSSPPHPRYSWRL
ncbi:MAG: hypothetical protein QG623_398 [Patescibacteria group bacterium]|nr:hypothetical protein [Patescibacteria group bacterium]